MKRMIALLICLVMSLSLAAFAQAEGGVPELAGTYYSYGYDVGTMFMNYYIHFYDEIPGLGRVFHAGMCMDQITFDGTRKRGNTITRNAEIAFVNEYGKRGQDARPFMKTALSQNEALISEPGVTIIGDWIEENFKK